MDDPRLGPLAVLVGTWAGTGRGIYPTIEPFDYLEEITFTDGGAKPFLSYTQRTRSSDDGRPLHAESGFVRWAGDRVEWTIASPTGVTEVHTCEVTVVGDETTLSFHTVAVAATPTAKRVDTVSRALRVRGGTLDYELHMAAVGEPHQLHLTATLHRQG